MRAGVCGVVMLLAACPLTEDTSDAGDVSTIDVSGVVVDAGEVVVDASTLDAGVAISCDDYAPCGGDVVGVWNFAQGCMDAVEVFGCADVIEVASSGTYQGTIVWDSDLSLVESYTTEGEITLTFPASCLADASSCEEVQATYDAWFDSAVCTGDATVSCTCDFGFVGTSDGTGTYVLDGNIMTMAYDDGYEVDFEYCRDDDTLWIEYNGSIAALQ